MSYQKKENKDNEFEGRIGLVYARVSSRRQEIEGTGLQSQEGRCKDFLQSVNVPYIKTFPDSFSGGGDFMNRPAMKELIRYIDQNKQKRFVIVFDDLKRFARDVEFHLKLRTAFKSRHVVLKCLNYNFDDSSEGRFVEVILAAGAELERHQNHRQVMQKMTARMEAGYWTFGSKRGYVMISHPAHGKLAVPHNTDGPLLKTVFEGFASGRFVRVIDGCKYLVEKGFWTKKADQLTEKLIGFFKDPFYAGFIEYPKWEITRRQGKHEALISMETFESVQKRLNIVSINKKIRIDHSEVFPMRGLLTCEECGGHLTGAMANGRSKKYPYYYCQNNNCPMYRKTFHKDNIETDFKSLLRKLKLKTETVGVLKSTFDRLWNEETKDFQQQKLGRENAKKSLTEKLGRLSEMAAETKSNLVRMTYEKQIEQIAINLEEIEGSLSTVLDIAIPYRTALEKATLLLKNPYKYWVKADFVEKQKLFYFIFQQKLPYTKNEGYRTGKNHCFAKVFEEFAAGKSQDVDMPGKILNQLKDYLTCFWEIHSSIPRL